MEHLAAQSADSRTIPGTKAASLLRGKLRILVMASPMFIASTLDLLIAQCKAGIIGSIPALNARTPAQLDADLTRIRDELEGCPVPYAINIVAHRTNERLDSDLEAVLRHKVPIVVLALGVRADIVDAVHAYGGLVLNDVATNRQARRCAEAGVDGLVAVAAGAGGHTGSVSPFALVTEIREWWSGLLILSGCIATGRSVLAAEVLGADLAYVGSPFLASTEANTAPAFRQMIVESTSADVVVTNCFTGANATFLRPSLISNGLDPDVLAKQQARSVNISGGGRTRRRGATSGAPAKGSGPSSAYSPQETTWIGSRRIMRALAPAWRCWLDPRKAV